MSQTKARSKGKPTVISSRSTLGSKTPLTENSLAKESLWKGPYTDGDGITNSLLCKFIVCRERFRLSVVEGLREVEGFDPAIEYGQLWHEIKEAYRSGRDWKEALLSYKKYLLGEYPASTPEIEQWSYIVAGQFMVWLKQPAPQQRVKSVQICTEDSFKVPYTLPSGRTIFLKGKYDSISMVGNSLYIEDDKSKGKIDEKGIADTMFGNLQMGLYHAAARQSIVKDPKTNTYLLTGLDKRGSVELPRTKSVPNFVGTKYHIVRRPLSEQYPIKQRAKETSKEFWDRVIQQIAANPSHYLFTMIASLTTSQLNIFRQRFLDPWLEALCDWWDYMVSVNFDPWRPPAPENPLDPQKNSLHYQTPWNVYNSLFGGFRGDFFDYLTKGHEGSLIRVKTLFPELEGSDHADTPQTPKPPRKSLPRPQKRES